MRCSVGVRAMKRILHAVPKKKFVAKDLFVAIKDRLAGYIAQVRILAAVRSRAGSGGGIRHSEVIGKERERLQHNGNDGPAAMRKI